MRRALSKLAKRVALREPRVAGILLFGSHARGEAEAGSDLDLMVLLDDDAELNSVELYKLAAECFKWRHGLTVLSMGYRKFLDLKALTPLLLNLVWDAVVLYDRHGELEGFLEDMRKRIQAAGLTRVRTGRAYYWRLPRPGAKVTL